MNQEKLEERVEEIFVQQGFEVREEEGHLRASREGEEKDLFVYSSEIFSEEEVLEEGPQGIVFVDEGLSGLKDDIEVSVVQSREDKKVFSLPSYEIMGEVAVINEMTVEREEAIQGILENNPQVETILLKKEGLSGDHRVGEYELLHGEETETVHTEFGVDLKVDPTKVYFSERFSTERDRVVSQIKDGEKVLVMFAGVGPFAIMAAERASPEKVIAVEKNPAACEYLKENIKMNKVEGKVEAYCCDVRDFDSEERFDRIVMPLPGSADEYLEKAMRLTEKGGTIHYYRFQEDGEREAIDEEIKGAEEETGQRFETVARANTGERGPSTKRVCIDLKRLG